MPFDDDGEADTRGFRPPPHPDDRIWRHPSELRSHPIAAVDRGGRHPAGPHVTAPRRDRPGRPWGAVVVAGVTGAVLAGTGVALLGDHETVVDRPVVERVAMGTTAPGVDTLRRGPVATTPTVVTVSTPTGPAGSGVVVRGDGIVVTAAALVAGPELPSVVLPGGGEPEVEVLGVDQLTGLAVLDVAGGPFAPSVLAVGDDVVTGRPAQAVGRDGGDLQSTAGTVGPARRHVGRGGRLLHGVEVTGRADTATLGGPVVDGRGAVLGVTVAVEPGEACYMAPVEVARRVARQMIDTGTAPAARMGVEGRDAGPGRGGGMLVTSVVAGGPADDGGIEAGDRIVEVEDRTVADTPALVVALGAHAPGEHVRVGVVDDGGGRTTVDLRLDAAPTSAT